MVLKVTFFDRFKHFMMPNNPSKYTGLDYFFRAQMAGLGCAAIAMGFTYPLDLLHTRLSADFTPSNRPRIYESTFQCFNRTNIEEGRLGLFKGIEFAATGAFFRAIF